MAEEFERYFLDYAQACDRFDAESMASFFHSPCVMVNDEFVALLPTEQATLGNMRDLLAHHRRQGYGRASVAELHVEHQAENLAIVRVHWRVADREGSPLWDWHNTYNLANYGSGWRVLVSTTHSSAL